MELPPRSNSILEANENALPTTTAGSSYNYVPKFYGRYATSTYGDPILSYTKIKKKDQIPFFLRRCEVCKPQRTQKINGKYRCYLGATEPDSQLRGH